MSGLFNQFQFCVDKKMNMKFVIDYALYTVYILCRQQEGHFQKMKAVCSLEMLSASTDCSLILPLQALYNIAIISSYELKTYLVRFSDFTMSLKA